MDDELTKKMVGWLDSVGNADELVVAALIWWEFLLRVLSAGLVMWLGQPE